MPRDRFHQSLETKKPTVFLPWVLKYFKNRGENIMLPYTFLGITPPVKMIPA